VVLGGFGGIALVARVRCSSPGKDAGSVRIDEIRARLRTPPGGEQRGLAAQPVLRQTLLGEVRDAVVRVDAPGAVPSDEVLEMRAGLGERKAPERRR
jgi:hypothetical protein